MRAKDRAEIVERKGHLLVRIELADGTRIMADRMVNGRIKYDKPEHVPRVLKQSIVPDLFRQIDAREFG